MLLRLMFCIGGFLLFQATIFGQENDIKIKPSGFAYYEIGQIESMTPDDGSLMPKMFNQHFNGRLTLEAIINQNLRIVVGGESQLGSTGATDISQKITSFVLKEAQGSYSFGDPENPYLKLTTGYFPFKYNPESTNLGEYLFRTGSYPGYIITDFDNSQARLMGLNLSSTVINDLRFNVLLTSEYVDPPFFDYSLSFLAAYKHPSKILDFGAGIDFDRLIPIVPSLTTSHTNVITDNQGNVEFVNGDTAYYTKIGTKIMGRLTFDPKPLLPFAELFGVNDLKLYGEFAILGLKNYGTYFSDISQRIPVMIGFDIPCFKMLDIVSFEMEYYGQNPAYVLNIPTASNKVTPDSYPKGLRRSFFKWSFYGVKTITKGWAVKGLIGRDHYRSMDDVGNYDPIERMNGPYDWHYNVRLMYSF